MIKNKYNFDEIVDYCSKNSSIFLIYERLCDKKTIYQGSRQENVSCPWHGYRGDIRGSATLYPSSNSFFCHACSKYPLNVVDFVKKRLNLNFFESIKWLESSFSFKVPQKLINSDYNNPDLTKEKVRETVKIFEKTILDNRNYFTFEQYSKIFYIIDKLTFNLEKIQEDPIKVKKILSEFSILKEKVLKALEKKWKLSYGPSNNS